MTASTTTSETTSTTPEIMLTTALRAPKFLKVGTDFSGMDMPVLALKRLGVNHTHVFSSDIEPSCNKFLTQVVKPEIIFKDVTERRNSEVGAVDLYVFGAPCQPFSSAGKRLAEADDRGVLARSSMKYIIKHRPRAIVCENVPLFGKSSIFKKMLKSLGEHGYIHHNTLLNTKVHGAIPQNRSRLYMVAIRADSLKRPFKFPEPVPLTSEASELLLPPTADENAHGLPPKTKSNRARDIVKGTYKKLLAKGIDPAKRLVVTDIGCSPKFNTHGVDCFPCMTAGRARYLGWWISLRGRCVRIEELMAFQGVKESDIKGWRAAVSTSELGKMLGNTMTLSVVGRVLLQTLWAAGLVAKRPVDPWAPSSADSGKSSKSSKSSSSSSTPSSSKSSSSSSSSSSFSSSKVQK